MLRILLVVSLVPMMAFGAPIEDIQERMNDKDRVDRQVGFSIELFNRLEEQYRLLDPSADKAVPNGRLNPFKLMPEKLAPLSNPLVDARTWSLFEVRPETAMSEEITSALKRFLGENHGWNRTVYLLNRTMFSHRAFLEMSKPEVRSGFNSLLDVAQNLIVSTTTFQVKQQQQLLVGQALVSELRAKWMARASHLPDYEQVLQRMDELLTTVADPSSLREVLPYLMINDVERPGIKYLLSLSLRSPTIMSRSFDAKQVKEEIVLKPTNHLVRIMIQVAMDNNFLIPQEFRISNAHDANLALLRIFGVTAPRGPKFQKDLGELLPFFIEPAALTQALDTLESTVPHHIPFTDTMDLGPTTAFLRSAFARLSESFEVKRHGALLERIKNILSYWFIEKHATPAVALRFKYFYSQLEASGFFKNSRASVPVAGLKAQFAPLIEAAKQVPGQQEALSLLIPYYPAQASSFEKFYVATVKELFENWADVIVAGRKDLNLKPMQNVDPTVLTHVRTPDGIATVLLGFAGEGSLTGWDLLRPEFIRGVEMAIDVGYQSGRFPASPLNAINMLLENPDNFVLNAKKPRLKNGAVELLAHLTREDAPVSNLAFATLLCHYPVGARGQSLNDALKLDICANIVSDGRLNIVVDQLLTFVEGETRQISPEGQRLISGPAAVLIGELHRQRIIDVPFEEKIVDSMKRWYDAGLITAQDHETLSKILLEITIPVAAKPVDCEWLTISNAPAMMELEPIVQPTPDPTPQPIEGEN